MSKIALEWACGSGYKDPEPFYKSLAVAIIVEAHGMCGTSDITGYPEEKIRNEPNKSHFEVK